MLAFKVEAKGEVKEGMKVRGLAVLCDVVKAHSGCSVTRVVRSVSKPCGEEMKSRLRASTGV